MSCGIAKADWIVEHISKALECLTTENITTENIFGCKPSLPRSIIPRPQIHQSRRIRLFSREPIHTRRRAIRRQHIPDDTCIRIVRFTECVGMWQGS